MAKNKKCNDVSFNVPNSGKANYGFFIGTSISIVSVVRKFYCRFGYQVNSISVKVVSSGVYIFVSVYSFGRHSLANRVLFRSILQKHLQLVVTKNLPVLIIEKEVFSPGAISEDNFISSIFSSSNSVHMASAISHYIKLKVEGEARQSFIIDKVFNDCQLAFSQQVSESVKGIKIQVKGRINGSDRSKKVLFAVGQTTKQSIGLNVDYNYCSAYTSYGVVGVKVWVIYLYSLSNKFKLRSMCLLKPKRIKFSKKHRSSSKLQSVNPRFSVKTISRLAIKFPICLVAKHSILLDREQLISAYNTCKRSLIRKGAVHSSITCDHPFTSKGLGSRIGKGKGSVQFWKVMVKKGSVLFFITGADNSHVALSALKSGAKKLPVPTDVYAYPGIARQRYVRRMRLLFPDI